MIPEQHRKKAAWVTICIAGLGGVGGLKKLEGERTVPYYDIGGIPTACFGETANIKMSDRFTHEQCEDMLGTRVEQEFGPGVDRCMNHNLTPTRKASYTSFAYNGGVYTFCHSSIARKENAGDPAGACEALLLYDKVKEHGALVRSQGLHNRRVEERALCRMDLAPN